MADLQTIAGRYTEAIGDSAPAANAAASVTGAAKAGYTWYITGYSYSMDGNPVAGVEFTIATDSGGAARKLARSFVRTTAVDRDVMFERPLKGDVGKDVKANLPALGAGVKGSVVLRGFQVFES